MKQTAVEWLEFRYKNNITIYQGDFEEAKEMEKQQIQNAYEEGFFADRKGENIDDLNNLKNK